MTGELRKQIEEKLGVYYVSPHASAPGTTWEYPGCGNCFCTVQAVHTHSRNEELVETVLQLVDSWVEEIIGEENHNVHCSIIEDPERYGGRRVCDCPYDLLNTRLSEQRKKAGLLEE